MTIPREPVRIIGIIVSCILAVVSLLNGEGVLSEALAGTVTDAVNAAAQLLVIFIPIIGAEIARRQVTPVAAPRLPAGTTIEAITPEGSANYKVTV